ncbi:MAG: Asp-tRNA(Asn)/Glu-tRNA(Gln) amidotransferase subunit GatC [Treponema sp.]|nr:Asp-tRNA(Asn)/Glu-tRNA(Gln) amidotransferase subunit GatC [Treponema sp.]MCL2271820.1 Asp-tRNA(Asn)/Glu-tRNA(Gln) amidotransferase subunit GatC [Treponema sp.]
MQIDDKLISYLEDLSLLTLSGDEKTRLTGDLQKILNYIARLDELNTDGVPERSHPWDNCASFDNANAFREDIVRPSLDRELVLMNAPFKNDEFFIAPKTVE